MDVRLSNATLACWKHLTYPTFDRLSSGNLLQLAALSRLKQLNLLAGYDVAVGPSRIPGLLLPASVETLLLSSPVEAGILSLVPTGLQELQVLYAVRCPVYEPDAFVPSLRRLRQLTQLKLHPRRGIDWPAAGPAFYALTASTNLVHLDIVDADFPEGVWRHVFSPRHKLPHRAVFFSMTHFSFLQDAMPVPTWGILDLSSLVSCCPNLCQAGTLVLQPGFQPMHLHVSQLHKLTALTCLSVSWKSDGN